MKRQDSKQGSLRSLELTPEITAAIQAVSEAIDVYEAESTSASVVEIPKLDLADRVLQAVRAHSDSGPLEQLAKLPRPKPVRAHVTHCHLKRQRRSA